MKQETVKIPVSATYYADGRPPVYNYKKVPVKTLVDLVKRCYKLTN